MGAKVLLDEQAIKERYDAGESQASIATDLGVCQATIGRRLNRMGVRTRHSSRRRGADNHNWKGGRTLTEEGYVLVPCPPEFQEMANYFGYVREHRLEMAKHLGRPLRADETVHHINDDHQDNDITNLQLRIGRHGKGAAFMCMDCGSTNVAGVQLAGAED
jgi:hypothetical protein